MKKPKAVVVEVTTEGFELSDGCSLWRITVSGAKSNFCLEPPEETENLIREDQKPTPVCVASAWEDVTLTLMYIN
jgi:hypothetical protein